MNHLLRFARECEELQVTDPTEVILEGTVQDAVVEVQEAGELVEQAETEIRSANDAVNSLYTLASTIEEGVTPADGSAEVIPVNPATVEVALESIYHSLGVVKPASLSMEAGFLDDPKAGIAKIKEHAVRILTAIVEAFRRAADWIRDYLAKSFNAAELIEKRARSVLAEVRRAKADRGLNGKMSNKVLAKALGSNSAELSKRLAALTEFVKDARKCALGEHVELVKDIVDDFAKDDKDTDAILKLALRITDALEKVYGGVFAHGDEVVQVDEAFAPEGTDTYSTEAFPGAYYGVLVLPQGLDTLRHLRFVIRRQDEQAEKEAGTGEIDVLSKSSAEKMLEAVIEMCQLAKSIKTIENTVLNPLSKKLDAALNEIKKSPREMDQKSREIVGVISIMAPQIARGVHVNTIGFVVSVLPKVVRYVEASAAYWAETEAAPKALPNKA